MPRLIIQHGHQNKQKDLSSEELNFSARLFLGSLTKAMATFCDEGVQATNDEAAACKRCAVQLGYWHDPYIGMFMKAGPRKSPEMNRGTYARVKGMQKFIDNFIKKVGINCQIINLGAGFDTLYWQLLDRHIRITNYIEVDFPDVTMRKCYYIKRNKQLLEKIHVEDGEIRLSPTDLHGSGFHIVSTDLRKLNELSAKLADSDVRYDLPTLVIAECVIVYIVPGAAQALLTHLNEHFAKLSIVIYEQVNLKDRFGEVMVASLRERGCPLAGADACQSLESQLNRLKSTGSTHVAGWDMVEVYNSLPSPDRVRIQALEMLDEQEILTQLLQHYCIVTGANNPDTLLQLE